MEPKREVSKENKFKVVKWAVLYIKRISGDTMHPDSIDCCVLIRQISEGNIEMKKQQLGVC